MLGALDHISCVETIDMMNSKNHFLVLVSVLHTQN